MGSALGLYEREKRVSSTLASSLAVRKVTETYVELLAMSVEELHVPPSLHLLDTIELLGRIPQLKLDRLLEARVKQWCAPRVALKLGAHLLVGAVVG